MPWLKRKGEERKVRKGNLAVVESGHVKGCADSAALLRLCKTSPCSGQGWRAEEALKR